MRSHDTLRSGCARIALDALVALDTLIALWTLAKVCRYQGVAEDAKERFEQLRKIGRRALEAPRGAQLDQDQVMNIRRMVAYAAHE